MQLPKDISNRSLVILAIATIVLAVAVAYIIHELRSTQTVEETEILNIDTPRNDQEPKLEKLKKNSSNE